MNSPLGRRLRLVALGMAATVAPALALTATTPASAGINFTVGGGYQSGFINFNTPLPQIIPTPPPTTPDAIVAAVDALSTGCPATSWWYQDEATGGVIATQALVNWTGPFNGLPDRPNGAGVLASGNSIGGECYSHGGGSFAIQSVEGKIVTGNSINCSNLTGSYTREGSIVIAGASGTCTINGYSFPATTMTIRATLTPTAGGAITSLSQAALSGAFTVGF